MRFPQLNKPVVVSVTSNSIRRFLSQGLNKTPSNTLRLKGHASGSNSTIDLNKPKIDWYTCGPTVYDSAHIGHARTYISQDIIRRVLEDYFKTPVNFAMGITDVDDKIIDKGIKLKFQTSQEFFQLAANYEKEFLEDLDYFNVRRPNVLLRVTEHIDEIIRFINKLMEKQHAYLANDGVYFSVDTIPLCRHYDVFNRVGEVISSDSEFTNKPNHDKKNSKDFALWKVTNKSLPGWDSPWGYGRPGWHIECSTMTYSYFGDKLDIHSGGIDLQFPHHTNEIAQSQCHNNLADNKPWVDTWIHTGHLNIDGLKMSKSLKNFITIRDYIKAKHTTNPSDDLRLVCLQRRYSTPMTFSIQTLELAQQYRQTIESFLSGVTTIKTLLQSKHMIRKPTESSQLLTAELFKIKSQIDVSLRNDVDTPNVLKLILDLISENNKYMVELKKGTKLPLEPLERSEEYIRSILSMFGLKFVIQEPVLTSSSPSSSVASAISSSGNNSPLISSSSHPSSSSATSTQKFESLLTQMVEFRSQVRQSTVDVSKELKQYKKSLNSSSSDIQTQVLNAQQMISKYELQTKEMLQACDQLRQICLEKYQVKIDDLGVAGSNWQYVKKEAPSTPSSSPTTTPQKHTSASKKT